ncbi:hypothetical protein N7510_008368 [Penicillium lagena]|uniref:uncharacterized protein n=1 Tax=Penicillium lagena TaxID=94218 RepID=UPI00253FAD89|nr:uncharacterized protein N7510_008368 [Penicillium lagena]KAJ5605587.1 hypothetical protein N7510_008368 [Penicillium lagena]
MKTSQVLGLLAALSHSAFSLYKSGTYQIGSAALSSSLVLSRTMDKESDSILFEDNAHDDNTQVWNATASNELPEYFYIYDLSNRFINCGTEEGTTCFLSHDSQFYRPELVGDNKYELVEQESGYFLRVNEDRQLQLAKWDQSPNEQFVFVEIQE